MSSQDRATTLFEQTYGSSPLGHASAPGRVNLIGEHTDYQGGFVFPAALQLSTCIAFRPNTEGRIRAVSAEFEGMIAFVPGERGIAGWGAYLAGVTWALQEAGFELGGVDIAIATDVPAASGLSSSAALEVAIARMFREVFSLKLNNVRLAKLCQRAEREYVGMPSGILDQFSSSVPEVGQAIVLDCRSLDYDVIAKPADWSFVILDSQASRALTSSAYAERVKECEAIAQQTGVSLLRDLQAEHLEVLDGLLLKRARHIYTENARVQAAAKAMKRGDIEVFGNLMKASHTSLKDDYEVSSSALDSLVEASLAADGCLGSRLTGAGFGGCTVSLLKADSTEQFVARFKDRFVALV